jgi:ATP-dependent helicase/nuclease subunit A
MKTRPQLDLFVEQPRLPALPLPRPGPDTVRLPDQAQRDRIRHDLDTNLLVEAGAGSGKTTELVERMLALVQSGRAQVEEIAAVTFTRKAAAELRERFQTRLEQALRKAREDGDDEDARTLDRALRGIDRAFIGTIHSFCSRLLRERPIDAGLDPGFREILPAEDMRLRAEFWLAHIERLLAAGDASLAELARIGIATAQLVPLFNTIVEFPDVDFPAEAVPAPDTTAARVDLAALMDEAKQLMPDFEPDGGWDALQRIFIQLRFRKRLTWDDDVRFIDAVADTPMGARATLVRWSHTPSEKQAVRQLEDRLQRFRSEAGSGGRLLRDWWAHRYPIVIRFAQTAAQHFAEQRRRLGTLTFNDLLMLCARLLRVSAGARAELGARYRYLLVDEFQDTDPLQAELLLLLAARPTPGVADWRHVTPRDGALFVVGDPKQSIYRFRRADIALYNQVKERFREFGAVIGLIANFRSRPPIERFANAVFERLLPAQATTEQAGYAPLRVQQADAPMQGVYWYETEDLSRYEPIADRDADRVASWIAARIAAQERTAGDFLVLTQQKRYLPRYARALEARGVPVQVTGAGLGIETELEELELLLRALADPGDATLTLAVLVGLFFGLDYEQLTTHVADGGGRLSFTHVPESPVTDVDNALFTLHEFWRITRTEPADVAVARIVERLGLLPFAAAGELGESRAGALLYILDAVRKTALDGDASLAGALAAIQAAREAEEAEAPLEPGRSDVVRIMNLHQAKGLEARVVILAAPIGLYEPSPLRHITRSVENRPAGYIHICQADERNPTLARPHDWSEHEQTERRFEGAERDRHLYVAVTRARDELIVGRVRDKESKSPWHKLYEELELNWPCIALPLGPRGERPHLELSAAEIQQRVAGTVSRRTDLTRSTYRSASVTTRVKAAAGDDTHVTDPSLPPGRGPDWGTAVHGALEAAGRGVTGVELRHVCRALLRAHERPLRADGEPAELDELIGIVHAVAQSELWSRARSAGQNGNLLVEMPFALSLTDQQYAELLSQAGVRQDAPEAPRELLEGVIDLAFHDGDGWTLVDYKSDAAGSHIDPALLERYRAQVSLYAAAWTRISGQPVRDRMILFTATAELDRW